MAYVLDIVQWQFIMSVIGRGALKIHKNLSEIHSDRKYSLNQKIKQLSIFQLVVITNYFYFSYFLFWLGGGGVLHFCLILKINDEWIILHVFIFTFYFLKTLFVLSLVLIPWVFTLNLLIPNDTHCSLVYLCRSNIRLYQSNINKQLSDIGLVTTNIGLPQVDIGW